VVIAVPFEAAKCPGCGAAIQVPSERETAICMYCGNTLSVKEAVQKFKIELSGQVSMSGISSVENDLERANQCLAAQDWQKAFKIFSSAIDKQANSYKAWMGCLTALTQNYSWIDYSWVQFNGVLGIEAIIMNCLKYAPPEQKPLTISRINQLSELMKTMIEEDLAPKVNRSKKRKKVWGVVFFILSAFCFFGAIMTIFKNEGFFILLFEGLLFLVFFILCVKPVKISKFVNHRLQNNFERIHSILLSI
jgi:hypothetical protein